MMKMKMPVSLVALASVLLVGTVAAQMARTKSVEGATVAILAPEDGDTVGATFTVQFGLKGMGVAPAGINHPNTGHHHLLIDVAELPNSSLPLPATDNIRHFGGGQTEVDLTLPPGQHTLQLVLGDYIHVPHDTLVMSEKITITVE